MTTSGARKRLSEGRQNHTGVIPQSDAAGPSNAAKNAPDDHPSLAKYRQWHEESRQEAADLRAENQRLMRERDRLAGIVERVKALADRWERTAEVAMHANSREWCEAAARSIRAVVEGDGGGSGE